MLQIFDRENGKYDLPNGRSVASSDMRDDPDFSIFFKKVCAVDVVDGTLMSYQPLAQLANTYGFDYSSDSSEEPEEVLAKVIARKKTIEENPKPTVSDTVLKAAKFAAVSFTDAQAREVPDLFDAYQVGVEYEVGDRFIYNGQLYKVVQKHTSSEQWVPGQGTESLYEDISLNEEGHVIWQQPSGAQDAYNSGDIVEYNGKLYQSTIDGNVWAPDAYPQGWTEYTEA